MVVAALVPQWVMGVEVEMRFLEFLLRQGRLPLLITQMNGEVNQPLYLLWGQLV
jgi:hypothetical protein